jgi:hypothetical protein
MGEACSRHLETRNPYKLLIRKTGGKIPFGRFRRRLEDNIKMDLKEIGWDGVH